MKTLTYKQAVEILTTNSNAYLGKYFYGCNTVTLFDGTSNQEVSIKTAEKILDTTLLKRVMEKINLGSHSIYETKYVLA